MLRLSYNAKRLIVALIWVPTIFSLMSHYVGLNWFGKFEPDVVPISLVLLVIAVLFVGPSPSEMREQKIRKQEKREQDPE